MCPTVNSERTGSCCLSSHPAIYTQSHKKEKEVARHQARTILLLSVPSARACLQCRQASSIWQGGVGEGGTGREREGEEGGGSKRGSRGEGKARWTVGIPPQRPPPALTRPPLLYPHPPTRWCQSGQHNLTVTRTLPSWLPTPSSLVNPH